MSRATSPSNLAAARIPTITDLRENLGYGDAKLARCTAFTDDLRVFRRRYRRGGLYGRDFWDWKSSEHQEALKYMTESFLDENRYGEVYWPNDPAAANFNALRYSTDRLLITQTIRQLIFRLNLQQYRNEKYKKGMHKSNYETVKSKDKGLNLSLKSKIRTRAVSPATTVTFLARKQNLSTTKRKLHEPRGEPSNPRYRLIAPMPKPSTTKSTFGRDNDNRAGCPSQASDRQQTEHEDGLNTTVGRELKNESMIDPNLERISSSVSSINPTLPPTHQLMHRGINQTLASPFPSPVPSDAKKPAEQATKSFPTTIPRPVVASSTDSKAGISFNHIVILSRTPIYQIKSWQPRGHFLKKSLGELIDELPFDNKAGIIGLIIRLTGPGVAMEESLERDQDANYISTKKRVMQIVKMSLKNHTKANPGSILVMDFEMEAIREDGVDEDNDNDDDVVLF